jgi:hypothetical protein
MVLPFLSTKLRILGGLYLDRPSLWCGDTDTATKSRDESASLGVERSGEFDLDYDGFAMMPLTETVQPIGKMFKRSVLRQHERERTFFECYCDAAWPRLVVMDV